mgnify:CR=1 FL=1
MQVIATLIPHYQRMLRLDDPAIRLRGALPWSAELVLTAVFLGLIVATRGAVQARRGAAVH